MKSKNLHELLNAELCLALEPFALDYGYNDANSMYRSKNQDHVKLYLVKKKEIEDRFYRRHKLINTL